MENPSMGPLGAKTRKTSSESTKLLSVLMPR